MIGIVIFGIEVLFLWFCVLLSLRRWRSIGFLILSSGAFTCSALLFLRLMAGLDSGLLMHPAIPFVVLIVAVQLGVFGDRQSAATGGRD